MCVCVLCWCGASDAHLTAKRDRIVKISEIDTRITCIKCAMRWNFTQSLYTNVSHNKLRTQVCADVIKQRQSVVNVCDYVYGLETIWSTSRGVLYLFRLCVCRARAIQSAHAVSAPFYRLRFWHKHHAYTHTQTQIPKLYALETLWTPRIAIYIYNSVNII